MQNNLGRILHDNQSLVCKAELHRFRDVAPALKYVRGDSFQPEHWRALFHKLGIDRVALPSALPEVPPGERVVARLPQLPLRDGKVDGAAFARALADAGGTEKQLMLLDIEALTSADDVTSLLLSPKGWLCTAEHKSCQFTCV